MTNLRNTKRALLSSTIALLVCFAMLLGTTYAWFTDSVTSSGNKIVSGTLKVDLELLTKNEDGSTSWVSIKNEKAPLFNYNKWEPGYVDVKVLKVENEGSLALKWKAKFVGEVNELADVIEVYVLPSEEQELAYPTSRDLEAAGYKKVGTLAQFVKTIETTTHGVLSANDCAYLGIALKMQETAGNEYQDKKIGEFDIMIVATQYTEEDDSFDDQYDADASLDFFPVSNFAELKTALANKAENILLTNNIAIEKGVTIGYNATINGAGYTVSRASGYTGTVMTVGANSTLTLADVTVDGGAVWTGEIDPVLQRGTVNNGVTATGALVVTEANASIILNKDAILQNNDGANAVNLGTRTGGTLTINGGEIINNHSAAGAIWGGGSTILNSGKVNGNHGGIGGAIRVVTNVGTVLTMNGGEMNHNRSDGVGGAIWAGTSKSNNVYVLNGGEMAYNYSPVAGGAMYAGYYETVKIGGTFKMHDNSAPSAAAIRFHNHASLVMTGGEIYNNGENPLFLSNNSTSIVGGKISDNFSYGGGLDLIIGAADIAGVIAYNLSTNHNTAYLAAEFNGFKFTVDETNANFSAFNFKPADGYTYTEGDEAKLVCLNEGYETYWDAATGTFRLQATNN